MKKAKALSKKMGLSFNDLILGIVSSSLKEHFEANGDDTDEISVSIPFTFQTIPKNVEDYKFGNDFVPLTCYLKLEKTIEDGCKSAKKMMDIFKRSWIPAGGYTILKFYAICLPHAFMRHTYFSGGDKHTIILSNVPGF